VVPGAVVFSISIVDEAGFDVDAEALDEEDFFFEASSCSQGEGRALLMCYDPRNSVF